MARRDTDVGVDAVDPSRSGLKASHKRNDRSAATASNKSGCELQHSDTNSYGNALSFLDTCCNTTTTRLKSRNQPGQPLSSVSKALTLALALAVAAAAAVPVGAEDQLPKNRDAPDAAGVTEPVVGLMANDTCPP